MQPPADRMSLLRTHGLTEQESRVYLALLDYPDANATTLADAARTPRNRLYEALESLRRRGLVEVVLEPGPRRYRAAPFERYLDGELRELQERMREIEHGRERILSTLRPTEAAACLPDSGEMRVLVGRRAVAREAAALLARAEASIAIVAPAKGVPQAIRHLRALHDETGALVRRRPPPIDLFLASGAGDAAAALAGYPESTIRVLRVPLALRSLTFIADEREMLLVQSSQEGELGSGEDFALSSTNPAFVADYLTLLRGTARGGHTPATSLSARGAES